MLIKPSDRTMKGLLDIGYYRIPRFQRPYSWDKENVDDFWNDAIASDDPDYFIGSFVLFGNQGSQDTYMVVDGQQRLTTATLLLAAIRNAFDTLKERDLAKGVQKLIEREDISNKRQFILQTETSYPYLQEFIQKYGAPQVPKEIGREEQALELAFTYLTDQVDSVLRSVDTDSSIPASKKAAEKIRKLQRLRDNALRLQLIVVELTSEDDAYLIFETLNTRGKDLGIADLVKNLISRLQKPANKGVDVAKDKWLKILTLFDESAAGIDINAFIYHAWLSRNPYTGKEKLFRVIRSTVTKSTVSGFLDDLVADAQLYRSLFEPEAVKWDKQEADVRASLRALTIFRVVQPVPMTLSILRAYRQSSLSLKQARSILRDMENFHVQFTAVTAQRTGGGTARMYAASAEQLVRSKDRNSRARALTEFRNKMRQRIPNYAEFEANFNEIEYSDKNTKQKTLVQYLLQRLDGHQRLGAPADYSRMTIEHILPQNPAGASRVPSSGVGKQGNLLLLEESVNSTLGNRDFNAKRNEYRASGTPIDPIIAKAKRWTDAEINARTNWLAKLAYDEVFKV